VRFAPTAVEGVVLVEVDRISDDRGFFARAWDVSEFAAERLEATWVQANVGFSIKAGTLRGMHFQREPHAEVKLVRCTMGAVWDVALDLRPDSPTYLRSAGVELTADNRSALWIPEGCAHGYQTLVDESEITYFTSAPFVKDAATGAGVDDPAFGITWPLPVSVISYQDRSWPRWETTPEEG
jgi:dTDP-4-dehydrorhamnose 3,5-epimerase